MNKILGIFLGSLERIIFWTTIGWTTLAVAHYCRHDNLANLGYVYVLLAVLTPINYYLHRRKVERDKLAGK